MESAAFLVAGILAGLLAGYTIAAARARASATRQAMDLQRQATQAEAACQAAQQQLQKCEARSADVERALLAERTARTEAQTRLQAAQDALKSEKEAIQRAGQELAATFKALSGEALKANNEAFLHLAKTMFGTVLADAKGDLGQREKAIEGLVAPLKVLMAEYKAQIMEMEGARQKAYGGLTEQVQNLAHVHQKLQQETGNLVSALRKPQVRGRWGELTLRRTVELCGLVPHCDFSEQVVTEESRPDMVIHLPGDREIVVDSKVAFEAYLDAVDAPEAQRQSLLEKHGRQVRTHMERLSQKAYWEQFPRAPEFVVMFLPGEPFVSAALEKDQSLLEDGIQKKVLLAGPSTLVALLLAVAQGWREERIAQNAAEVSEIGKAAYDRIRAFAEHVLNMGKGLESAVTHFNKMVGSLEHSVLPGLRRFEELGVSASQEISVVSPIELSPRTLQLPERDKPLPRDDAAGDAAATTGKTAGLRATPGDFPPSQPQA
jgi:DNA recombination protein RmuC